uniref:Myb/SANT-like DNA-binding domain-containing protein n=1 Tax=Amphimedon queenslandica TaxID=400682 RepID=A0A1X7UK71_AMPQE
MAERLNEPSQPRNSWTDKETVELICLWSDDIIQEELEGPRNKLVFEKISKSLNNKGYKGTTGQCRDKIKKLKKDYRKVKENNNVTGTKRKTCKFFEELDAILSVKPATSPSICISSEQGIVTNEDELCEGDTEELLDESDESLTDNPVEPGAIGNISSPSSSVSDTSSVIMKHRCDYSETSKTCNEARKKFGASYWQIYGWPKGVGIQVS